MIRTRINYTKIGNDLPPLIEKDYFQYQDFKSMEKPDINYNVSQKYLKKEQKYKIYDYVSPHKCFDD